MRKSKQFFSMPVVSSKEGVQVGTVKKLVIDPAGKTVCALLLDVEKEAEDKVLFYQNIHSVGNQAIIIDSEDKVEPLSLHPNISTLLKAEVGLVGSKLLVENGSLLGKVQDYWIEKSSGKLLFLDFSLGVIKAMLRGVRRLDIKHIKTIGKKIVIVKEGAEKEVVETGKFRFKTDEKG